MTDVAGFALGLPGLFISAVQYFEWIRFGRQFENDFGACLVRLEAAHLHMIRWGASMGIDGDPSTFDPRSLSHLPADEIETAMDILHEINRTFEMARETSESFNRRQRRKGITNSEKMMLDTETELERAESRFKTLHRTSRKIAEKYEKAMHLKDKARDRVVWALYERNHFNHLIDTVSTLVRDLEELFPGHRERQRELCRREVSEFDPKSLMLLMNVAGTDDELLKEAITTESRARGLTFQDITVQENARIRLGNEYAAGATISGGHGHTYTNLVSGGHSVSHVGNSYGAPSVFCGFG